MADAVRNTHEKCCIDSPSDNLELTWEELQGIQAWVTYFVQECQRIIVDFPQLVKKSAPSPLLSQLLSRQ